MTKPEAQAFRRYGTEYYYGDRDKAADVAKHGAAMTEHGAIRAAIVRVFLGEYAKATIVDRWTGVALYHVVRAAGGIHVRYGSGVEFKQSVSA
jgi:hypothetical protein